MEHFHTWFVMEYETLRASASNLCAHERRNHTLNPTALVNEAYLTLAGSMSQTMTFSPSYLQAALIRTMKRKLIDHARARNSLKRRGMYTHIPVSENEVSELDQSTLDALELDEFLQALGHHNPRAAAVFRIRLFTGLRLESIASRLGVSRRTATSDWNIAVRFAQHWSLS